MVVDKVVVKVVDKVEVDKVILTLEFEEFILFYVEIQNCYC